MNRGQKTAGSMARTAVLALVLVSCLATPVFAGGTQQGPRISIAEPLYNFGSVAAGTVLEHVFEIRNAGDGVLEIGKVAPS